MKDLLHCPQPSSSPESELSLKFFYSTLVSMELHNGTFGSFVHQKILELKNTFTKPHHLLLLFLQHQKN